MKHSRRQFIWGSAVTGSVVLVGCLADETGAGTNGNNDDGGSGEKPCEKVDFMLVDEPPHDPERPPQPTGSDEEDEWNEGYLGEGMADSPTVPFDRINLEFQKPVVDQLDYGGGSVFYADLFTSWEEFEESVDPVGDDSEQRATEIDFEDEAVIAVLSGFGSSSVVHEWVRVDENCDEYHLHGYYVQPYIQTEDYTTRVSGVIVEKPDDHELDRAWVSLTVDEDTRVNFPTDEDVQVVNGDVNGDGDDDESDDDRPVGRVQTVQVDRPLQGEWHVDDSDATGIVVKLEDNEEVRAITREDEVVDRFLVGTNFEEETVFFIESVGPNACYRELDVSNVDVTEDENGSVVVGDATVVETGDEDEGCDHMVEYPAVLVRIETGDDIDVRGGAFRITDGWGDESVVESVSMSEFAQE